MIWVARLCPLAGLLAFASPAAAQSDVGVGLDLFAPGLIAPTEDFSLTQPDTLVPVPYTPPVEAPPAKVTPPIPLRGASHDLALEARLVEGGAPLADGLTWRVFATEPGEDGKLPLLVTAKGGATTVQLGPGDYLVHAAFGRAGATKRVTIADDDQTETLILDAGGLELNAVVGEDQPLPASRLSFEILQEDESGDLVPIVPNAQPGLVLRLGAGKYHIVSRYGDVNSVVRADIDVLAGKLTQAVMRHTGAEVTLKLVSEEGGEAIADTSWTVLTQDGVTIHESIGAFPSMVLAAGDYTAVATYQDQIYSRDFAVQAGLNRDIEVRLADLVVPEPAPEAAPLATSEPGVGSGE
jgi:hypothetical protein